MVSRRRHGACGLTGALLDESRYVVPGVGRRLLIPQTRGHRIVPRPRRHGCKTRSPLRHCSTPSKTVWCGALESGPLWRRRLGSVGRRRVAGRSLSTLAGLMPIGDVLLS